MQKKRADIRLRELGLCDSRAQAHRLIMAGKVRLGPDQVIKKPNSNVPADAELVIDEPYPYASRGAEKLKPALEAYVDRLPPDFKALDIGASTGGFTDLMLQNGASRVYAVDVGYGLLAQKLRDDDRVILFERVNARHLDTSRIPETVDVITADVSFISVKKILPAAAPCLASGGFAFILVKPQFEAQRSEIGSKGVVRDSEVQQRCVSEVIDFCANNLNWQHCDTFSSPITGPKGNREYITVFTHG